VAIRDKGSARGRVAGDTSSDSAQAPGEIDELVNAARAGDREALDQLVRLTYEGAYTLAFRLTGNEEDACDVVQEAYLRAQRGLRRFRGDAQFTTWLYRITANCSATVLARRAKTRTEVLVEDGPWPDMRAEHDPEGAAAVTDERARVSAALGELPWRLRQVVVLRDIYDLPHAAIASELGISEGAAKVRLHRARRHLRELLHSLAPAGTTPLARRSAGAPETRGSEDALAS
jgi:RNA polymerase sigma-70 factor (ECF subfamily)